MARISIPLPASFFFTCSIPVRVTDLNYGGHVGNDSILSIIHEARMQFLAHYGYSEKDLGGESMIMGDVSIVFKNESFYGDELQVHIAVSELSRVSFDLIYKIEKETNGKKIDVAHAKTGMVCYNYEKRRVAAIPEQVRQKWSSSEGSS